VRTDDPDAAHGHLLTWPDDESEGTIEGRIESAAHGLMIADACVLSNEGERETEDRRGREIRAQIAGRIEVDRIGNLVPAGRAHNSLNVVTVSVVDGSLYRSGIVCDPVTDRTKPRDINGMASFLW